jgi:hypothetical protein
VAVGNPLGWLTGPGAQANFFARYGVLVHINTSGMTQIRDPNGQFNANQKKVREIYYRVARVLQADIVRRTQQNLIRPRVSTGRLSRTYRDPRMISVDQFGFVVGVESFLATSQAKYWRQIEFGTKGVVPKWIGRMVDRQGIPLYGLWDFNARGWGSGPWSRYGAGQGQKLHPYSRETRENLVYGDVRDAIGRRLGNRRPRAPYRRQHIRPKDAFSQAWDGNHVSTEVIDAVIDAYLAGVS